jgi:hypothetical protein
VPAALDAVHHALPRLCRLACAGQPRCLTDKVASKTGQSGGRSFGMSLYLLRTTSLGAQSWYSFRSCPRLIWALLDRVSYSPSPLARVIPTATVSGSGVALRSRE